MSKPIHESIIDAFNNVKTLKEYKCLLALVRNTKFPKNHQEIAQTLTSRGDDLGADYKDVEEISGILNQQRADEEKKSVKNQEKTTA